jgi:hypothetical protein
VTRAGIALAALLVATLVAPTAGAPEPAPPSSANVQRHHYAIAARVRPLLLFWIGRSGVGDAVVTKRRGPSETDYSLLIGSDPERAPRRINRWGYIDEEIRGHDATLIGLMTESDEDSIEQAEANLRKRDADRTFKIIRATVENGQARSVVSSVEAPANYSFRQAHAVLDLARSGAADERTRVISLPQGTRPGFLSALSEAMQSAVDRWRASRQAEKGYALTYVYHGKLYALLTTRAKFLPSVRVGGVDYSRVIASDFEVTNTHDGERTDFSITYGTEGPLAGIPIAASYQPRWWLQIDLTLDDTTPGPALPSAPNR